MLNKVLEQLELKDLESLIQNSVSEGKSIEYKLSLPGNSDKDKKEFLADVSSFANTLGGDLIFGIKEEKGVAKKIEGISISDVDAEIRKYDNLIRDGIEPRIQIAIRPIPVNENKTILIMRINKSWTGPHRVKFQGHDKFYARNSAGKYALDTMELRTAFNLSDTLIDKIRIFRTERITALMSDDTPIPFYEGGKIILHLIPLDAFSPNFRINFRSIADISTLLKPIYSSGWNNRINLEGILTYSGGENSSHSYVQLYRNGIIEAVEGLFLSTKKTMELKEKYIPSIAYERELLKSLPIFLKVLRDLNVNPPIFIFLTITGIKGFKMHVDPFKYFTSSYQIDKDVLLLPESLIETYDTEPKEILKPMFDLIWNACGFNGSFNFDENGNWIGR